MPKPGDKDDLTYVDTEEWNLISETSNDDSL